MNIKQLEEFVEANFSDKPLMIVSSREPYIHKNSEGGVKVDSPAGGLTTAMDSVLRAIGGTWVAWGSGSADAATVDESSRVRVPPDDPSYTLKRVWLSKSVVNNYYHGYSNRLLWPLCHISLDRVYIKSSYWDGYVKANRTFADSIIEEAAKNSVVWVHDYHLCLVPRLLKEARPDLTIVHFWHIPWPDWGVFRVCPQHAEILSSLLGNDLIGFQVPIFAKNFMDCVKEALGAEVNYHRMEITWRGHTTRLKAFPISVDSAGFEASASTARTKRLIKKLRRTYNLTGYVGVGVDRLEYTKGLIKRLQAIELFFERYERLRGKFTFIQVAVPTRMKEPYLSYKKAVEALVDKINKRFEKPGWRPVAYINTKIDHRDLVAYYRMADVAIISSVYDGMNLVAKEYVASQVDERGALILSEFAGAAEELEGALFVNPYNTEEFSGTIKRALVMPQKEKSVRMQLLRKQVLEFDIYKWITDILDEILKVHAMNRKKTVKVLEHIEELEERLAGKRAFVFLDYDGTLTPIVESPERANLTEEMRTLLRALSSVVPVAVISGRSLEDVKSKVGMEDLIYAGNHGAEIWDGKKMVVSQHTLVNRVLLQELLNRLKKKMTHIDGVLIEDKTVTASIHYRMVDAEHHAEVFEIFSKMAAEYSDTFRVTSGKKVFEIRPKDIWNKGDAVSWIASHARSDPLFIYVGDDTTDEDAYRVVSALGGLAVSIGENHEAGYYLEAQNEVGELLKAIFRLQSPAEFISG